MRSPAVCLLLCALPLAAAAPLPAQGEAILARVDRMRHPWPTFTVELTLASGSSIQRWRVSVGEGGDVRLDGLSPAERGRAVLQKGDDLWLLLPGTKRPIRVTPQQRLMGPASAGDVARTRFAADYRIARMEAGSFEGRPCWRLDLVALRPILSARTVRLWVDQASGAPLQGDFLLASGKPERIVRFGPPVQVEGRPVVPRMEIQEPNGATLTLSFAHWHPGRVDPALFAVPGS